MQPAHCRLVALLELLERIFSDGVQQAVAHCAESAWLGCNERLVDQSSEKSKDVGPFNRIAKHNCLRRGQVETAGEDSKFDQDCLLGPAEKAVAPVNCLAECLMSRQCGPAASGEQPETIAQPIDNFGESHDARQACRELNRQRHSFQARADLRHRFGSCPVELKVRAAQTSSLNEQMDRLALHDQFGMTGLIQAWNAQRRSPPDELTRHAEWLSARRNEC